MPGEMRSRPRAATAAKKRKQAQPPLPAALRLATGGGFIVAFQHCGVTPAQNKHCREPLINSYF